MTRAIAESLHNHDVFVLTRRIPGRNKASFNHTVLEYNPKDAQNFFNLLNRTNPDVVFVYSDVFDFFRQIVKTVVRPRLIVALCGANYIYNNRSYAMLFHRQAPHIEKIICHSVFDRDYKFCSCPSLLSKTVVIPNAVDVGQFDSNIITRESLAALYQLDVGKQWVLNVSNFFPGKGQEHLIDVMKGMDFEYIQISSDIEFPVGKQLEIAWKKKIHTSGVQAKLLKNLPRHDIVALFKASDIFAFTSEKEVAPLVILEAMAARTPWVSFDVGNVRGLAGGQFTTCHKDRRFHCVISAREIELFRSQLKDTIKTPSLGNEGRKQIEKEMTWDIVLPKYKEIIEQ